MADNIAKLLQGYLDIKAVWNFKEAESLLPYSGGKAYRFQ
jgi:hypothetical protein